MSLINRMLSDLEERRGGNLRNVDQAIDGLRATPATPRPRKKRIPPATLATGAVIAGLLALCVYLFLSRPPAATVAQAPIAVPSAAPAPEPAPAPAAAAITQPSAASPTPAVAPATTAQPVVIAETPSPAMAAETPAPAPEPSTAVWPEPAPESAPAPAPRQPMLGKAREEEHEEPLVEPRKAPSAPRQKPAADSTFRIAESAPASTADQAVSLLESGDTAGAEALLRQGLASAPGDAAMARVLGHILLARSDAAGAVSVLRPAAPTVDADPDFHALLAAAEQRSGDHESAARRYRELLDTKPGEGAWLVGLGISQQALGDAKAADSFLQALADPALPAALHDFAMQRATQVRGQQP